MINAFALPNGSIYFNSGILALLEHVRRPSNTGRVESPDRRASAQNPLCGDELELTMRLEGERIDGLIDSLGEDALRYAREGDR